MEESRLLSTQEISQHNSPEDCWLVIEDGVWDCTSFINEHPGGPGLILRYAGRDATKEYSEIHTPSTVRNGLSPECFKGNLDRSTIDSQWLQAPTPSNPAQAVPDGEKPPLHTVINLFDFEDISRWTSSPKTYAFTSTASTDCWTRDQNIKMLQRVWFRPRVLRQVREVDPSSEMLGCKVKLPVFICPTGLTKMMHPEAEKAMGRAAEGEGIAQIISTNSSFPAEEILKEAPGVPLMFQLYVNKDRKKTEELLAKLNTLNVRAIFLTVDAAGRGKRESDERLRVDEVNPVTGKKGGGLTKIAGSAFDQGVTWDDIKWIRSLTNLPLVLKGIMTAADAKLAMEHKVDGVMLSNHGGRNLDFTPPSILILLEMHRQCPEIFDQMEVYIDGGFRRGVDILKAVCLGAKAVGLGRPFLFSLIYGEEGVRKAVDILREEMESAMKLLGITNLSQVHPGLVNTSDVDHLVPSSTEHPYAKWRPKARL
ncbi:hypothetical protein PRZ48_004761 [Zasmidium cellare]|uniref:(S)-2-hydroxy-acid oxidase n=1 Tax=Zasmidium cellare TaxID=395010 RepID=A0ABR0ERG7_ZASCE|nr:hypothetical protein PRZ48_004761 [Zasmidium cellare]